MSVDAYYTIIGLPGSGKTTFLAALWHLLDADEVETSLVLDQLIGDHRHLNAIVAVWRRCEEVPRTSLPTETDVAILVHEPSTGRKAKLAFPDLSGESFEQQVALRHCKNSYVENFSGEGGIMLFVTADRVEDGVMLADMADLWDTGLSESYETVEWSSEFLPQQVQLVELLQFLQRPPFRHGKRRLAVMISAWDVVPNTSLDAADWLRDQMPLLYQFLCSNLDSFEFRVYGISAQGGNVKTEAREQLLHKLPSERVSCMFQRQCCHDLTAPILWLMGNTP